MCFLSGVMLEAMENVKVYAPKKVRISVGYSPKDWHYTSKEFTYENNSEPQYFTLDDKFVGGKGLLSD